MTCPDCAGTRAVPDDLTADYAPCPSCVIEASLTFVCSEPEDNPEPAI